jgi:hypothetical protein
VFIIASDKRAQGILAEAIAENPIGRPESLENVAKHSAGERVADAMVHPP